MDVAALFRYAAQAAQENYAIYTEAGVPPVARVAITI
jgi:hypothetical protein